MTVLRRFSIDLDENTSSAEKASHVWGAKLDRGQSLIGVVGRLVIQTVPLINFVGPVAWDEIW